MDNKPQEPRNMEDLYAAFEAADNIVLKKYSKFIQQQQ
jgi:hypothetical protein